MKRMKFRWVAIVVSIVLMFSMLPGNAWQGIGTNEKESVSIAYAKEGELDRDAMVEATKSFIEAAGKFVEIKELASLSGMVSFLGGAGAIASGGIVILKMMGILEDPTEAKLNTILDEIHSIEKKLDSMDKKLDKIISELKKMQINDKISKRAQAATDAAKDWKAFDTDYQKKIKSYVQTYTDECMGASNAWWTSDDRVGVNVLYSKDKEGKLVPVLTSKQYSGTIPDKGDGGVEIVKDECIGVPAKYIPQTKNINWDADTYQKTLISLLEDSFIRAADNEELDWAEKNKTKWKSLDSNGKKAMAKKYAPDIMNAIFNIEICKQISTKESNEKVGQAKQAFENYCEYVVKSDSGLNSMITQFYNTYGFEGEVKEQINQVCDTMIAMTGYYGMFIVNVMGQDSLRTTAEKNKFQNLWSNTIKTLKEIKKGALSGHDNLCYITRTIVDYKKYNLHSSITTKWVSYYYTRSKKIYRRKAYPPQSWTRWETADDNLNAVNPTILDDVDTSVMFAQYYLRKSEGEDKSFPDYLNKFKVGMPSDFKGNITTTLPWQDGFPLADQRWLKCRPVVGDYYTKDEYYRINDGRNPDRYFMLYDRAKHDYVDSNTGRLQVEKDLACRALYREEGTSWKIDELHVFFNEVNLSKIDHYDGKIFPDGNKAYRFMTDVFHLTLPIYVLESTPLSKIKKMEDSSPLKMFYEKDDKNGGKDSDKGSSTKPKDADWSKLYVRNHALNGQSDKKINEGIRNEIDNALKNAKEDGIDVSLTKTEKKVLAADMKKTYNKLNNEISKNDSIRHLDVFGINGDEKKEIALAEAVVHGSHRDDSGNVNISAKNMDMMAEYEPWLSLRFEKKDGKAKAVIDQGFNIEPMLVVWDPEIKTFRTFHVDDAVMKKLGIKMNVRIPASFVKGNKVQVIHRHEIKHNKVVSDTKEKISGMGNSRYVEMEVKSCSPFEIRGVDINGSTGPGTGDMFELYPFLIMIITATGIMIAMLIQRRRMAR